MAPDPQAPKRVLGSPKGDGLLATSMEAALGLQVVHSEERNAVGIIDERLIAFVRSAALTTGALDAVEAHLHPLRERHRPQAGSPGAPVGLLAVVPAGAGLSDKGLIERQAQLMKRLKVEAKQAVQSVAPTFVALSILGDGAMSSAMRAVIRVNVLGHARVRLFSETGEAAAWLAGCLAMDAAVIGERCLQLQRSLEAATLPASARR